MWLEEGVSGGLSPARGPEATWSARRDGTGKGGPWQGKNGAQDPWWDSQLGSRSLSWRQSGIYVTRDRMRGRGRVRLPGPGPWPHPAPLSGTGRRPIIHPVRHSSWQHRGPLRGRGRRNLHARKSSPVGPRETLRGLIGPLPRNDGRGPHPRMGRQRRRCRRRRRYLYQRASTRAHPLWRCCADYILSGPGRTC